jgi:hypothetical protein
MSTNLNPKKIPISELPQHLKGWGCDSFELIKRRFTYFVLFSVSILGISYFSRAIPIPVVSETITAVSECIGTLALMFLIIASDKDSTLKQVIKVNISDIKSCMILVGGMLFVVSSFSIMRLYLFFDNPTNYVNTEVRILESGDFLMLMFFFSAPLFLPIIFRKLSMPEAIILVEKAIEKNVFLVLVLLVLLMYVSELALITMPLFTTFLYVLSKDILLDEGIGKRKLKEAQNIAYNAA